jgi:two-component system, OmpR family, phosphate regulon response regulator PhoB
MAKTILIIEDDRDILDIMEYILADEGFKVISATSAAPLSKLSDIRPTMILLDNRLADGLGKDFCREIKLSPDTSHLPVIIVSASRDIESLARESLADGYIAKPFDLNELLDTVNRYC